MKYIYEIISKSEKNIKIMTVTICALLSIATVYSCLHISEMNTRYSISEFFPKSNRLIEQSREVNQIFQLQERAQFLVVLSQPRGSWLNTNSLQELRKLTEEIKESDLVENAISFSTIEGAVDSDSNLNIGPLFDNIPLLKWASYAEANKLIYEQLISKDFKSALLAVEPKDLETQKESNLLRDKLNELSRKYFPEAVVKIGGGPEISRRFQEILDEELKLFVELSFVVFCLIFFLFVKGFRSLILAFGGLLFCNLFILAGLAVFKIPFTILLSTLPIIISVAVISVMIHTMHRWAEVLHEKPDKYSKLNLFKRSIEIIKEMMLPNFLGSLTTALGFFGLYLVDIPIIKQYGLVVSVAVLISWVLSQILLFAFMYLTRPQLRKWSQSKSLWSLYILNNRKKIIFGTVVLIFVSLYHARSMKFSGRLFNDLSESDPARTVTESIDREFGGCVPYDLVLVASSDNFWKNSEQLGILNETLLAIRKNPEVGTAISVVDFLGPVLPKNSLVVAETLFLFSMAEKNPIRNFLTEDARSVRLALRFRDVPTDKIFDTQDKIRKMVKEKFQKFPDLEIKESGLGHLSHNLNQSVSKDLVFGFRDSLLLIGLLLAFVFKSFRWAFSACIPNLLPPIVLMGAMGLFSTEIKPGIAIIFSIALGLSFNNTVYILSRLRKFIKKDDIYLPLKRTLLQEANPCLFETLIMFTGFAIFLASNFKSNQIFGAYMIVSILAGAIGDIVFMPALLVQFPRMVKVGIMAIFVCAVFGSNSFALSSEINTVLEKVQKQIDAKDDQATVLMKIMESNGEVKTRKIQFKTMRSKKFYALARIEMPTDIKGTALLSEVDGRSEVQWLFLPSTKQVRRVVNTKKSNGILGSELSIDDLNSAAVKDSKTRIITKNAKEILLETIPQDGSSVYSRVVTVISAVQFVPIKTDYYKSGSLFKTVEFLDYRKINGVFRAHTIRVKNQKNSRGTDVQLENVKVNSGLREEEFTVAALKD